LVADDRPLVFALDLGQDAEELVRQARTIGYENLVGLAAGAVDAWQAAGLPVATTELLDARSLDRPVIDVRQASEHALGHIPNSLHVELGDIARRATSIPTGPLAVMCAHGERAASAASLLERAGRSDVAVVIGGPDGWAAGGAKLAAGS
jgi:rhodanese-related sulfurtransferase